MLKVDITDSRYFGGYRYFGHSRVVARVVTLFVSAKTGNKDKGVPRGWELIFCDAYIACIDCVAGEILSWVLAVSSTTLSGVCVSGI